MQCHEFEARLNDLLDLRSDPRDDRPLGRHANSCAGCQALLSSYIALGEGLGQFPQPLPSQELADRVLAELSAAPARLYRPIPAWAMAAAAAVLVLIVLGGREPQPAQSPPLARTAVIQQATPDQDHAISSPAVAIAEPVLVAEAAAAAPFPRSPDELAVQAAEEYLGAAREVTSTISHLWRLVPQTHEGHTLWMMAETAPGQPEPMPAMAQWTTGLKPLTDSASGAMNFLLEVLHRPSESLPVPLPDLGATPRDAT
jgi:hypothetical protein